MDPYLQTNVDLTSKEVQMWRQSTWGTIDGADNGWRNAFNSLMKLANNSGVTENEETSSYTSLMSFADSLEVDSNVKLLMEKGFPKIVTTNQIDTPFDTYLTSFEKSDAGKALNIATTLWNVFNSTFKNGDYSGDTWQPWIRNTPAWAGSKGISTQYTFNFALGQFGLWNAKEEVVKPILNLMAPCLPRKQGLIFAQGPFPNSNVLLGSMLKEFVNFEGWKEKGLKFIEDILTSGYANLTWTMQFGNWMTFYHMIIENCEVSFSNKVDIDGWPVQGSIELKLVGLVPLAISSNGTTNLAAKFGSGN